MKLYTEKQVVYAIRIAFDIEPPIKVRDILRELTPIELPSDEEIDAHVEEDFLNSTEVHKYSEEVQLLMKAMCKAGMKCMRDKIQEVNNGDKKN